MALVAVGNQPVLINEGAAQGGNIAIQTKLLQVTGRGNIPIVQVQAQILTGNVDNPEVIFGQALQNCYAEALQYARKQPSVNDQVYLQITHEGITANGGHWGTESMLVTDALDITVTRWEAAMQSGEEVDLSAGALEILFTFTLTDSRRPARQPRLAMGARSTRNRPPNMGYQENKKRMYNRTIHNEMYTKCLAIRKVPFTVQGLCFPMAFLYCQCRRLVLDESKRNIIDVIESKRSKECLREAECEGLPYRFVSFDDRTSVDRYRESEIIYKNILTHYPQLIAYQPRLDNQGQNGFHDMKLVLFNPYKTSTNGNAEGSNRYFMLDEADTEAKLESWCQAAGVLHKYVVNKLQRAVDYHDFIECCQAYADAFSVHIHVLRVETQMEETHFFVPVQLENEHFLDHVYVLFGDSEGNYEHCNSVTHRRRMCRGPSISMDNAGGITNYCDFCYRPGNYEQLRVKGLAHMSECYRNIYAKTREIGGYANGEVINVEAYLRNRCNKRKFLFKRVPGHMDRRSNTYVDDHYVCTICYDKEYKFTLKDHKCHMQFPKKEVEEDLDTPGSTGTIDPSQGNLWVYDIETRQSQCAHDANKFVHEANCVCLRHVYKEDQRLFFDNMDEFCDTILTCKEFLGATIIAHNGGSFDHQFVIHYLEKQCIHYKAIPRPGTVHKYISIEIPRNEAEGSIFLKDFLMFFPSSLKSIAESLQLELQKGDFPHLFNTVENDGYIGSIPPIDSDADYFCLRSKKDPKEIAEMREWHQLESQKFCTCDRRVYADLTHCIDCRKEFWRMNDELVRYCWLDTDILAQCVAKFRQAHLDFGKEEPTEEGNGWIPSTIEPFRYCTLAQLALAFFQRGHRPTGMRPAISKRRTHAGWSKKSIMWLEEVQRASGIRIQHAGNSDKEFFDAKVTYSHVDGYCWETNTVYEFMGCFWHGCPNCYGSEIDNNFEMHPKINLRWVQVFERTMEKLLSLNTVYSVEIMWECDFDRDYKPSKYDRHLCNIIQNREFFFGGRTEVFSAYAQSSETQQIHHLDVTSMYPYICATKMLPFGHPTIVFGTSCSLDRLRRGAPDAYFGYVRCRVIPNPHCYLGLLPQINEDGRLEFNLYPKVGTWFTEEIYLAMDHGYRVEEIFEVLHFDEQSRRDDYMRGYMSFFLRSKQEAEGWKKAGASSETPSETEKDEVCDRLYRENGSMGKMRKQLVAKNPVKRALAKLYLNCLWGKLAQDSPSTQTKIVYSYQNWMQDIVTNVEVDQKSLKYRFMPGQAIMCYYEKLQQYIEGNKRTNIWLSAAVTAWARVILHEQMFHVGPENVLYCDTDSVVFLQDRNRPVSEFTSRGLGNWANETEEGNEIEQFFGLAPKCYMKVETNHQEGHMKCKGVRMTLTNRARTTPEVVGKMLENMIMYPDEDEDPDDIYMDTMIISSNSVDSKLDYAKVFTRYGTKKFRAVLSKRQVIPFQSVQPRTIKDVPRLYLAPFGPLIIEENPSYANVYDDL